MISGDVLDPVLGCLPGFGTRSERPRCPQVRQSPPPSISVLVREVGALAAAADGDGAAGLSSAVFVEEFLCVERRNGRRFPLVRREDPDSR